LPRCSRGAAIHNKDNIMNFDLNVLAAEIFAQNKAVGWWDDLNRCILTTIQLISTEIAEATEGERKNKMDDHLPHRKMGEVELADALIRTLDIGGRFDLKVNHDAFSSAVADVVKQFAHDELKPAVAHFWINVAISRFGVAYADCIEGFSDEAMEAYAHLLVMIVATAEHLGYAIFAATREKVAYNKTRQDHKREARAEAEGKKF
jgi:hypothetical protein